METAAPVEIEKVAFGDFLLMISTAAWKSRKERSAFPQFPQARRRSINKTTNNKTGHFTCYKNRTFLFAIDTDIFEGPHVDFDLHGLAGAAESDSLHWRHVAVISAPGERDVTVGNQ
jgi:hypothetical protein